MRTLNFCFCALGRRGSFGWACRWRRRAMSAISRKSPTPLRTCCRTYSDARRTLAALVYGVASLPLGTPVELEIIFEVAG